MATDDDTPGLLDGFGGDPLASETDSEPVYPEGAGRLTNRQAAIVGSTSVGCVLVSLWLYTHPITSDIGLFVQLTALAVLLASLGMVLCAVLLIVLEAHTRLTREE
ncbi:hypothetical protein HTZ84_22365 [Haloterrigena sp. SYSU A558-1]|uniref:Uncharacterized protein n=1 Tax=Haloterrigena gelatinilytica TaxID=2741724 RepID=A0ABX2LFH8_9EURY|nr:hypothetical protein [Haloterrigena gelatinilytica]NUC75012.1 hypothetical protein [Haloterrigena gelatinilytica]